MLTLWNQFDDLFSDDFFKARRQLYKAAWPAVDIEETKEGYLLTADVPGLSADQIEINVADGVLTVKDGPGDLQTDAKGIETLIPKLKLLTDITKAVGQYKAADIEPKPNRPRVTIQRPYFDVTTSQVVDRTLILMAKG